MTRTIPSHPPRVDELAVSVRGLTKRYGQRVAVDSLDIDLPSGVVAGFVGPNGAGKTTSMAMLLGLVRPSAGGGTVLGCPIERPISYLSRVGALIETPAFYPALTGVENLRVLATIGGHEQRRIPELLELVDLTDRAGDRFRKYSLGMKQRLGIAAALLGDPELLVLDEPANGLDPDGVRQIRSLVGRLGQSGRTVLVSSHDLSELEQICDWLVLIDTGRSLYQGPSNDLLDSAARTLTVRTRRPEEAVQLRTLFTRCGLEAAAGDGPHPDTLRIHGDGHDLAELAARVNRAAFDAGVVLVELSPQRQTLEDRYLDLVHGGTR